MDVAAKSSRKSAAPKTNIFLPFDKIIPIVERIDGNINHQRTENLPLGHPNLHERGGHLTVKRIYRNVGIIELQQTSGANRTEMVYRQQRNWLDAEWERLNQLDQALAKVSYKAINHGQFSGERNFGDPYYLGSLLFDISVSPASQGGEVFDRVRVGF